MTLSVTHWIRGYLYDTSGNGVSGALVTVTAINGDGTTTTTYTSTGGYYQINIQDVCEEGDLININFYRDEVPIGEPHVIDEFIRVDLDYLTQEVNATFQGQFKITTENFTLYLPTIRWNSIAGNINKNIRVFNFKNDEIDSVDIDINSEPFSISGWLWADIYNYQTISGKIEAIMHMQNEHKEITIHNVNSNLDGTYVIRQFTFNTVKRNAVLFEWIMQLEYAGD